jgi:hypothetical protein
MRQTAVVLLFALVVTPVFAQTQTQLVVPLTTADGKRAPNIKPADLSIAENEKPLEIVKVEPLDLPVRVTLAIENSRAMSNQLVLIRSGAKAFVNALPEGMEFTLLTTAPQPRILLKPTKDKALMLKSIDNISPEGAPGRFLETFMEWVKRIDKDKEKGMYTPVLVLTGSTYGEEFVYDKDVNDALDRLPSLGGRVYSLLMSAKTSIGAAADVQASVGKQSAQMTNGKYEEVFNVQRIQAALPEIGAEVAKLQSGGSYLITVVRPANAPPRLGPLSLSAPDGVTFGKISMVPPKK